MYDFAFWQNFSREKHWEEVLSILYEFVLSYPWQKLKE
jgi:hypothetical protein